MFFWLYMFFAAVNIYLLSLGETRSHTLLLHLMMFGYCLWRGFEVSRKDEHSI